MSWLNELEKFVENKIDDYIYTSLPAQVIDVSELSSNQTITAQISINRPYQDGTTLTGAIVSDVPVLFPSAGNGLLSFPIKVGDHVLLVFSKRDMSNWLVSENGAQTNPETFRRFSITDAVAIPGLYTFKNNLNPDPENVQLKLLDDNKELLSSITMKPNGGMDVDVKENLTINVGKEARIQNSNGYFLLKESGEIEMNGARITTSGDVITASGISLDNHVHPINSGSSAPGPTGTPQ